MDLSANQTSLPTTHWRLILSSPASGAWNMALDEAILEAAASQREAPTLRLYAWEPACLSLGYAQPIQDVDQTALAAYGWHLVRRPTGGRAILHVDELTYSVSGPEDEPRLTGGVLESYRLLSAALLNALHRLGIPAQASPTKIPEPTAVARREPNPVCFEVPSNYEITYQGLKIIGSAQARRKGGVLQHGSLPLFGDLTRIVKALVYPDETTRQAAGQRLLERATTLENILGLAPDIEPVIEAVVVAFEETLHLQFQVSEPSAQESERAHQLVEEKYAHSSWNERV